MANRPQLTWKDKAHAAIAGLAQGTNLAVNNQAPTTVKEDAAHAGVSVPTIENDAAAASLLFGVLALVRLLCRQSIATRWQMVAAAGAEAVALLAYSFWPSNATLLASLLLAQFVGQTLGTLRIAMRERARGSRHEAMRSLDQAASYLSVTLLSGGAAALKAFVDWGWGVDALCVLMVGWAVFLALWDDLPMVPPPEKRESLRTLLAKPTVRWGLLTSALMAGSFQVELTAAQIHAGIFGTAIATMISWGLSAGRLVSLPSRWAVTHIYPGRPDESPEQHRRIAARRLRLCAIPLLIAVVLLQAAGFIPAGRGWVTGLALVASFAWESGMNAASPTLTALLNDSSAEAATANVVLASAAVSAGFEASHLPWTWAFVLAGVGGIATMLCGWRLASLPGEEIDHDPDDAQLWSELSLRATRDTRPNAAATTRVAAAAFP